MANLVKQAESQAPGIDPFRTMREWLRWDPFREMAPRLGAIELEGWNPSFEVRENKEGFVFRADVPGVKREDLEVSVVGNRLQIMGKREMEKETKEDTFYAFERSYGSFQRSFTMPDGCDYDHVRTDLADGVLTVVVPKRAEAQAKKIPIGGAATKS
ncbi:MAG: Hsp20 family protein [Kofleriaceae bacterium]|nr:Hsp20 family protein [Myxococcales bacterium]MCB9564168.1 Hsp20 family protein [Kofleriaceae bacterium]